MLHTFNNIAKMWVFYTLTNVLTSSIADILYFKLVKKISITLILAISNLFTLLWIMIYFYVISESITIEINLWTLFSIISNISATYILFSQMKSLPLGSITLSYGARIVFTTFISIVSIGLPEKSLFISLGASLLIIYSIYTNRPQENNTSKNKFNYTVFIPPFLYSLYAIFGKFAMVSISPINFTFTLLIGITFGSILIYIKDVLTHKAFNKKEKGMLAPPNTKHLFTLTIFLLIAGLLGFLSFWSISLAIQNGNIAYVTAIQMSRGNFLSMFDLLHNQKKKFLSKVHIYLLNIMGILLITL